MRERIRQEVLDALAFALIGYKGPWGRWAVKRVVEVWLRPVEEGK